MRQPIMPPSCQRAGFQADTLQRQARFQQSRDKRFRLTCGAQFSHDASRFVDDADRSLFQRRPIRQNTSWLFLLCNATIMMAGSATIKLAKSGSHRVVTRELPV
jgi:hypothetical protein